MRPFGTRAQQPLLESTSLLHDSPPALMNDFMMSPRAAFFCNPDHSHPRLGRGVSVVMHHSTTSMVTGDDNKNTVKRNAGENQSQTALEDPAPGRGHKKAPRWVCCKSTSSHVDHKQSTKNCPLVWIPPAQQRTQRGSGTSKTQSRQ